MKSSPVAINKQPRGFARFLQALRWFGSDEAEPLFAWAGKILPPVLILLLMIGGHAKALPAALVAIWCSFFVALFVWGGGSKEPR
mgnify:CR=1 FL=1